MSALHIDVGTHTYMYIYTNMHTYTHAYAKINYLIKIELTFDPAIPPLLVVYLKELIRI